MDGPELVHAHMTSASHKIRETAGELRTERDSVAAAFHRVAGNDWTGSAATSFRHIFDEWSQGLRDVEEGLAAMAELIEAARRDFAGTDDSVAGSMDTIAARVVDRLGG